MSGVDDAVVLSALRDLTKQIDDMQSTLNAHVAEEEQRLTAAFPQGDVERHRKYHDLLIRREERRERIAEAVIEKSLAALFWMAIVFACGGLVHAVWHDKALDAVVKFVPKE